MQDDLSKVDKSEEIIKSLGIQRVRVRVHGNIARIEVEKEDFYRIIENEEIANKIKQLGFNYVTLDLMGIRNGSFD